MMSSEAQPIHLSLKTQNISINPPMFKTLAAEEGWNALLYSQT